MNEGINQDISELIKIASGVKSEKSHWYTLGIPVRSFYSLEEQLDAVRKLGDSAKPEALEFVAKLLSTTYRHFDSLALNEYLDDPLKLRILVSPTVADGRLGSELRFSVDLDGNRGYSPLYPKALRILSEAYGKLRESTKLDVAPKVLHISFDGRVEFGNNYETARYSHDLVALT